MESPIDTRQNKLVLKLEHKILNMKGKACIANQGDSFMYIIFPQNMER